MIRTSAYTHVLVFLSFLLLSGCDGTAGPDGRDAVVADHQAPEITLIAPVAGAEISAPAMVLEAVVSDTTAAGDLKAVRFYVNGGSIVGDDSAWVTSAPFVYEWDFAAAGTALGLVSISAESVDTLGNTWGTPARFIVRRQLVGRDTLADLSGPGVSSQLTLPALRLEGLDTVRLTQAGTRFVAHERCILRYLRLFPVQWANLSFDTISDVWVIVQSSRDSLVPGDPLDSTLFHFDPQRMDRWATVNLGFLDESARTFAADESFFVIIRPVAEPDSMDAGISIGSLLEQAATDSAALETAYGYERPPQGTGWIPLASRDPLGYVPHLYLEAVIDYLPEGAP